MNTKRALPILFAVMFLVMVGFGIIIPVLPFFAEQLGATPAQLGWLMAVYSLMQFIFAPMWGGISDRIGRKPVMLIGIAGLSLSFFLFAVSTQLWMLFAARILAGFLSSANMPTTMAYVADVTTPENRGKGMGIIGAAVGLGFIFGPAIGGIFSKTSLNMPFFIAGTVSAITFLFVLFFLKESLPPEKRTVRTPGTKESRWKAFSGPTSVLYILQFFVSFSLAGLEATFAYFAFARAGIGTTNLGYIFMIMGLAGAVVQGELVGRLTKKFGEGAVIQMGLVVSAIGFGLILLTDSFVTAAIFLTVFGLGNGVIRPSVSALITKRTEVGQGSATGLLSSFDSLGRIAGPPIGGALYSMQIGLPYISGLIVSAIAFILYRFYMKKEQKTSLPA
ncbi:tetracycline resistance MFS efflux pump [Aneurinibacillus aneurinilyticus]|jgi:multidrug resistance protein|uniref:Transporter, major facilitator family protein n=1 Tax=Aneurinibacillus aneurinilyticus ATCC 12856 TaxID=649747 RepID=U1WZE3_ANEAE|nr:tetracycline resistance MFS efflux pump [Aneurinibacillus aneurinilyticus]ERI07638.1 transporter, major facilitator family protein [Aneurinibacillus aneurinilyticus ATCC 12856]MCI1692736.1 tetracycline resistance MFS efflux pump [Aneurinibacillus aneurinilyticus]MED0707212.1 tetracycline resistance MFS efflux pump [Aneurinibacillus aneurinilyticus]MED0722051.1 tetracycline resistance MFS efflux pump [Aneurinibacillus aneurinilyticus]MED0732560.1 tetracycline resistance MFS efflux pump [Aneu